MNEFLAAPASGLPSELIALAEQESAMHFFMNEVLAAPASGLASLPPALLLPPSSAIAEPTAKVASTAAKSTFRIMFLSCKCPDLVGPTKPVKLTASPGSDQEAAVPVLMADANQCRPR